MHYERNFLSYLWGIEMKFNSFLWVFYKRFLSYLWGIEMTKGRQYTNARGTFLSYLWGIEIIELFARQTVDGWLFILPMRNWNQRVWVRTADRKKLFILPMRNWNGRDTSEKITKIQLFILPMRNWNMTFMAGITTVCAFYPTYEELKF